MKPLLWLPDGRPADFQRPQGTELGAPWMRPYSALLSEITPEYVRNCYRQANSGSMKHEAALFQEIGERDGQTLRVCMRLKEDVANSDLHMYPNAQLAADASTEAMAQEQADEYQHMAEEMDCRQVFLNLMDMAFFGIALVKAEWAHDTNPARDYINRTMQVEPRRIRIDQVTGAIQTAEDESAADYRDIAAGGYIIGINPSITASALPTRTGLFRPISYWWIGKLLALRAASIYMEKFSGGFLKGIHPENLKSTDAKYTAFETALQEAGLNAYVMYGKDFQVELERPGDGYGVFENIIRLCDAQISYTVLGQSFLSISEQYGTYGKGNQSEWATYEIKRAYCKTLEKIWDSCVVVPHWIYNHGVDTLDYRPRTRLLYEHEDDLLQNSTILGNLVSIGFPVSGKGVAEQYGKIAKPYDPEDPTDFLLTPPKKQDAAPAAIPGQPEGTPPAPRPQAKGPTAGVNHDRFTAKVDDFFATVIKAGLKKSDPRFKAWAAKIRKIIQPYVAANDYAGAMRSLRAHGQRVAQEQGAVDPDFQRLVGNGMVILGAEAYAAVKSRSDLANFKGGR